MTEGRETAPGEDAGAEGRSPADAGGIGMRTTHARGGGGERAAADSALKRPREPEPADGDDDGSHP